jgi:hypothetical protein|tara:strand:- start:298 stop:465 length:168 start_codon:yes stop_codon:yes gene_type:complete
MGEDERQYMRVPKDMAEIVMGKLSDEGLIDEEAEVKWEGEFVSFPLVLASLKDKD